MVAVDVQVVFHMILYMGCFLCGLIVSIAVGATTWHLDDRCLLYGNVSDFNSSAPPYIVQWVAGPHANCAFIVGYFVLGCVLYGLGMTVYSGLALRTGDPEIGTRMSLKPVVILNLLMSLLVLIASCIITVGLRTFCSSLMAAAKTCKLPIKMCGTVKTVGYRSFRIAEGAAWFCTVFWMLQVFLYFLRHVRNRRREPSSRLIVDGSH